MICLPMPRSSFCAALVTTGVLLAATAALRADARADAFLRTLQKALDAGDRQTVIGLVDFPATVISGGFNIPVKDKAALVSLYDGVFTPSVRCAIAQSVPDASGAPAKRPPIQSGEGLSFGGGIVSAHLVAGSYKITRLTVISNTTKGSTGIVDQRIAFRAGGAGGARVAQLAGRLTVASDVYVATLRKGEVLDARIDGFAGRGAVIRAIGPAQAAARPPVPDSANRVVHVVAGEAGDYRLEVVRLASACDPDITYRLNVSAR